MARVARTTAHRPATRTRLVVTLALAASVLAAADMALLIALAMVGRLPLARLRLSTTNL